jgi:cyclophilin family peptidyl-prolyl cis-trans isomerase
MKHGIFLSLLTILAYTACAGPQETKTEESTDLSTEAATTQTNQSTTMVIISTDFGDMTIRLYDETPQHRDNFIKLAKEGYYDGLLFHRVIQGFMIQGGDPQSKNAQPGQPLGSGGPGYTIPAEFNSSLIHKKGALSAARLGDQMNPQRASSGSQFYIVQGRPTSAQELQNMGMRTGIRYTPEQAAVYAEVGGTPFLDMQYTVFGEVVKGLEVIDKIAAVRTAPGDRPIEDVKFNVSVVEQ